MPLARRTQEVGAGLQTVPLAARTQEVGAGLQTVPLAARTWSFPSIRVHSRSFAARRALGAAAQWLRGAGGCYVALFCLFALLYAATATRDYTFDAVSYALQIQRFTETGEWRWLIHPHHLAFNAAGRAAHAVLGILRPGLDPLAALQVMNALLGALGVALFAYTAGYVSGDRGAGLPAGAGLGLSYGYWTCSTDGRVNQPGTTALIGALLVAAVLQDPRRMRAPGAFVRWSAVLGLAHALAVLLHQSHVLFGPAALLALRLSPGRPRRAGVAAYLGTAVGVVFAAYTVAAALALGTSGIGGLRDWPLTYAHQGWWWSFDVARNLGRDVRAFSHAVLAIPPSGGAVYQAARLALAAGAILGVIRLRTFWRDEEWPVAAVGPPVTYADPLPPVRRKVVRDVQRRLAPVLGAWAAAYALFFTFWDPGYFVFWVPLLVPFWLVVASGFGSERLPVAERADHWVPAALGLALLAVANTTTAVAPHARAGRNMRLQKALAAKEHIRPQDRLVVAGAGDDADAEVYVPYFARCGVVSVNATMARAGSLPVGWSALRAEIDSALARGGRVFVHEEILSSDGPYRILGARFGMERADAVRFFRRHYRVGRPARWRRVVSDEQKAGGNGR